MDILGGPGWRDLKVLGSHWGKGFCVETEEESLVKSLPESDLKLEEFPFKPQFLK